MVNVEPPKKGRRKPLLPPAVIRSSLVSAIAEIMAEMESDEAAHELRVVQSFRFPRKLVERLSAEAKARGMTKTDLAEIALEALLEPDGQQPIRKLAEEVARYLDEQEKRKR